MPDENLILVFGSNLAGKHGKGAALTAKQYYGAIYGRASGPQGNSYAIPTKNHNIETLPLKDIKGFVEEFLEYAKRRPDLKFKVTNIGCGLAGYVPKQIAPMFAGAPKNCVFSQEFGKILGGDYETFRRNYHDC